MKKIIFLALFIFVLCFTSCTSDDGLDYDSGDPDVILSNILANYRKNGMTSWWEIVAVYNANENPLDYKGFADVRDSLANAKDTNAAMASYVIVANIALAIGADEMYFEKYGEYKSRLKDLLENPTDDYTLNDYIFGYLALKTSGMSLEELDQGRFWSYLNASQKADGGFAVSGNSGDADMTAFAVQAMKLLYRNDDPNINPDMDTMPMTNAVKFLEDNIGENGAFSSFGSDNANSTAVAFSALLFQAPCLSFHEDLWSDEFDWSDMVRIRKELIEKSFDGLMTFKVKGEAGYAFTKGGKSNALATTQAAIALGDYKNKISVWEKLYLDSINLIY